MSFSQLLWATHRCQRDNGTLKVGKHWISLLSMELCCMAYIVSSVVQPTCTVVFPKWVYLLWACITHKHSASGWIGLANHWNSVSIICQQLMWKVLLVWFTNAGKNIAMGQKCMLISIWYYARFYLFLAPTPNWELCHCSLNGIYFSIWPIKWLCWTELLHAFSVCSSLHSSRTLFYFRIQQLCKKLLLFVTTSARFHLGVCSG